MQSDETICFQSVSSVIRQNFCPRRSDSVHQKTPKQTDSVHESRKANCVRVTHTVCKLKKQIEELALPFSILRLAWQTFSRNVPRPVKPQRRLNQNSRIQLVRTVQIAQSDSPAEKFRFQDLRVTRFLMDRTMVIGESAGSELVGTTWNSLDQSLGQEREVESRLLHRRSLLLAGLGDHQLV